MMGFGYGGWGWMGMIINLVISVAVIIGLVFLIIWIVKRLSNNNFGQMRSDTTLSAIDIAKERYAKGEITREEYQKLLADLESR